MRFGSLFSGIGGIDLGLERAGMVCAWQVEIKPYCQKVLAKHWPTVKRYGDIRELTGYELEPVDLLCGGFPCQPHSYAGKRAGSADERDLWPEFARLIRILKPEWVLAENVPGLLSSDAGRFFGRVLRDLAACGYDAEWNVLSAQALGAPHIRERVFIVAYPSQSREWGLPVRPRRPQSESIDIEGRGKTVANPNGTDGKTGLSENSPARFGRGRSGDCGTSFFGTGITGRWPVEPELGRVANGIPNRMDRLEGLGNAVVPQAAEWFGKRILALDQQR